MPGYVYMISFVFLAVPDAGNYYQLLPYLNGSPRFLYSVLAAAGSGRTVSASASFLTNEALYEPLDFSLLLTYPDTVRNLSLIHIFNRPSIIWHLFSKRAGAFAEAGPER